MGVGDSENKTKGQGWCLSTIKDLKTVDLSYKKGGSKIKMVEVA